MNITLQLWHLFVFAAVLGALQLRVHRLLFWALKYALTAAVMGLASVSGIQMIDPDEKREKTDRKNDEVRMNKNDPESDHSDEQRNWVWDQNYAGQFVCLQASHAAAADGVVPITPFEEWRAEFLARVASARARG